MGFAGFTKMKRIGLGDLEKGNIVIDFFSLEKMCPDRGMVLVGLYLGLVALG